MYRMVCPFLLGQITETGTGWLIKTRRSSMKYQVQENCLTIYLPREVDHHNAEEIKREADAVIDRNHIKYVIFDFEMTDFMDSSGIGVIMGRYKTVSLIGGEVWAVHTNARIKKILTLSGVTKIMQIYEEERA
jgi:stage II sporulation protein AA (anti-sigma F factor antagonist)